MFFKKFAFLFLVSTFYLSHSQSERIDQFGEPTIKEFELQIYDEEPDAPGIILYESGNYYAIPLKRTTSAKLVKEVHRKFKVFDAKKFNSGTVEIPYYDGEGYYAEEIKDYKAVTHNGPVQNFVPDGSFYKTHKSGVGNVLKFTFPNVQNGSILEYSYTIVTPYFYELNGWEFQHALPTLYSKFKTELPFHYRYNRALYGEKKLHIEKAKVNKDGFRLPSDSGFTPTEVALYAMTDIPSFQEEDYMLSRKNYISRIVYEPLTFISFFGGGHAFTRDWKDVDKRFEYDDDFGEQLTKKSYFKRQMSNDILKIEDDLERAQAVYKFIQNRYTWNGRYFNHEIKVKNSYEDKLGSVSAINLSLANALKAAKLDVEPVLISTRENGLPTELYPVLSNFNYVLTLLTLKNKKILLNATNKQAPFGIIPFQTLNVQGRVMDFKKGSYWMPIEPFKQNVLYANGQITANADGGFTGKVNQTSSGYIALGKRNSIEEETLQQYKKTQEKSKEGIEIKDYQLEDLKIIEKPLKENYIITINPELVGDKVILYPFFNKTYISVNPFKMKERSYPMDFGYPFTNTYLISIDLADIYESEQLPKSRTIKLPGDDGECSVTYINEGNKINIRFSMKLNTYRFPSDAYQSLKEYFGTMITMLKDEPIILKKI